MISAPSSIPYMAKLLWFSQFFTQSQIYSHELFEYVIPFNLLITWCYSSILKCKKIGLYLGTSTLSKIVDYESIETANKEVTAVL